MANAMYKSNKKRSMDCFESTNTKSEGGPLTRGHNRRDRKVHQKIRLLGPPLDWVVGIPMGHMGRKKSMFQTASTNTSHCHLEAT